MSLLSRLILATILLLFYIHSPQSSADEAPKPAVREVQIDPISRNFMAPFMEDFIRPEAAGLKYEEVFFPNTTKETLRGWYISANEAEQHHGAEKTVLFCMGNTGNISGMLLYAKLLAEGGVNVMLFDYQGFGGSSGIATAMSLLSDSLSAFDYLTTTRGIAAEDIGVFGVSLGSPLAIAVAAERNAGAVAVEDILLPTSQIDSMKHLVPDTFANRMALAGLQTVVLPKVEPMVNVPKLKCPLFLMHGERDWLLPPSGTMKAASVAKVPTRVWIMEGAGHAPETLEVNELEYASQIPRFFREALNDKFVEPTVTLVSQKNGDEWTATVTVDIDQTGINGPPVAWQIVVGSVNGEFRFARRHAEGQFTIELVTPFEPVHASAIAFENYESHSDGTWQPKLSELSQALGKFRQLQQGIEQNCRWQQKTITVESNQRTFLVSQRVPQDWDWFQSQLLPAEAIHPGVRPRYAREIAQFYIRLPQEDQTTNLPIVQSMLQYLPDDPEKYYQLDNAGFQLKLQDHAIARCLTRLARNQFSEGNLDEACATLRRAIQVAHPMSPLKSANVDSLTAEADFDAVVGE
jgi:pimeloyl-ACP methyl ester carboxylesterase